MVLRQEGIKKLLLVAFGNISKAQGTDSDQNPLQVKSAEELAGAAGKTYNSGWINTAPAIVLTHNLTYEPMVTVAAQGCTVTITDITDTTITLAVVAVSTSYQYKVIAG